MSKLGLEAVVIGKLLHSNKLIALKCTLYMRITISQMWSNSLYGREHHKSSSKVIDNWPLQRLGAMICSSQHNLSNTESESRCHRETVSMQVRFAAPIMSYERLSILVLKQGLTAYSVVAIPTRALDWTRINQLKMGTKRKCNAPREVLWCAWNFLDEQSDLPSTSLQNHSHCSKVPQWNNNICPEVCEEAHEGCRPSPLARAALQLAPTYVGNRSVACTTREWQIRSLLRCGWVCWIESNVTLYNIVGCILMFCVQVLKGINSHITENFERCSRVLTLACSVHRFVISGTSD